MLKRTLIVIAVALGIGCKDKRDQQIWMRSNDSTSWRGEGYSEDTIHVCIYDSCVADSMSGAHLCYTSCQHGDLIYTGSSRLPIGTTGQVLPMPKGVHPEWAIKDTVPRKGGGIITKWNDDFQKIGPIETVPKPTGKIRMRRVNPTTVIPSYILGTDSLGNIIEIDSLGNIIEDTVRSFNFVEPTPMEKILGTRESYILKLDSSGAPKWIKKDSLP